MGTKEIRFQDKRDMLEKYETRLKEIKDAVTTHAAEMRDCCFDLAMLKAWKKWDETIPLGTVVEFNDDMFLESGDENVTALMELVLAMEEFSGDSVIAPDEDEPASDELRGRLTTTEKEKK